MDIVAKIEITEDISVVIGPDNILHITRPSLLGGGMGTHTIEGADPGLVVQFLTDRATGVRTSLIQDVFPDMSDEDREFLKTGITPAQWAKAFTPKGE